MNNGGYNVNYVAAPPRSDGKGRIAIRLIATLGSVIMILIGAIFIAVTVVLGNILKEAETEATAAAQAEIVENVPQTDHDDDDGAGATTYAPVYAFEANGKHYRVKSTFYDDPPVYNVGDTADIYYVPDDPEKVYDPKTAEVFVKLIGIFRVVGIAFAAAGVAVIILAFVLTRKRRPDPRDELEDYYR